MSEINGDIVYAPEVVQPVPDMEQLLTAEAGASAAIPELPPSHPNVDTGMLTVGGLIKACPHYARLAETNPDLARTEAAQVVQRVQEREAMRETGMSDDAIKKQQWSAMRERHKEKVKVEEKPMPEKVAQEIKVEPALQPAVEQSVTAVDIEHAPVAALHEVPGKTAPQRTAPDTQVLISEAPIPVQEPIEPHAAMEQVAAQAVRTAQLEVERAHAAAIEAVPPVYNRFTPAQDAFVEAAHEPMRLAAQPESVFVDHELLPDRVPPEYPAFDIPGDVAKVLPAEEFASLSVAVEPGLENGETMELTTDLPATSKPELLATPEQQTVGNALEKEPLELYDDFTEALWSLVVPSAETTVSFDEAISTDEPVVLIDAIQGLQPSPAVTAIVAERLTELDTEEKEVVVPILREIASAVEAFREAGPEVIETGQEKLEELVTAFFEQLGIEYDSEGVEWFMATLLSPDFQLPQNEEVAAVDLEHEGTREAKLHFVQFVSDGVSGVGEAAERVLGKVVVFYAAHRSLPEYALAAV